MANVQGRPTRLNGAPENGKCGSLYGFDLPCDWEKIKCRVKGLKNQTACRTVNAADIPGFRRHEIAPWILNERAADVLEAWNLPANTDLAAMGVGWNELAEMHLTSVVPTCLQIEAGRHTCHPNEKPGVLFYQAARDQFKDDLRNGRLRWRRDPRGGVVDTRSPGPAPGTEPTRGTPVNRGGMGTLALVGAAVLLLARS